jgi:hypothetical protein
MPCTIRDLTRRLFVPLVLAAVAAPTLVAGQAVPTGQPQVVAVQVESKEKRLHYLATAQIWADPGELTPPALLAGPPLADGSGVESALDGRPFPCTFAKPGKTMGGNTLKFACTTATGRMIRVKYSDQSKKNNREIFAALAASRLLWALGFKTYPIYPLSLDCKDCPEDPVSGSGPRAERMYLAIYSPQFTDPVMVDRSDQDQDQGWRWGELDKAIDSLPEGALRSRQRQHFDALVLAGVLLQHGDRKPEQQRLACGSPLNLQAGSVRPLGESDEPGQLSVLVENPGATACDAPTVAVQDVGATFGGAGKRTKGSTAKMNLKEWVAKPVFQPKGESGKASECRGELTVSMAAGEGSMSNPRIGEAGRLFLVERLKRLTDAHLRAIFTAARVEQITEDHAAVDAWIGAFKDKVRQIQEHTCAP